MVGTFTVIAWAFSSGSTRRTQGGDFYLATSGDLDLATNGDFFMAMDIDWPGMLTQSPRSACLCFESGMPAVGPSLQGDPPLLHGDATETEPEPYLVLPVDQGRGTSVRACGGGLPDSDGSRH